MPTFEKYPFTNFHGMNLDWIMEKLIEIDKRFKEDVHDAVVEEISSLMLTGVYDADTETLEITLSI